MRRTILAFATLLGLTAACACDALAQKTTGALNGQVLDPAGAAVTSAKVTISAKDRGFKLELTTGSDGTFTVPDLVPGNYGISIQREGFKTFESVVTVVVCVSTYLAPKLELGSVKYVDMVEVYAVTLYTTTATVQVYNANTPYDHILLDV